MQKVRADFDLIAGFQTEKWNHNHHYHDFLLKILPRNCQHIDGSSFAIFGSKSNLSNPL
jgi:hypothetical protein